MMDPRAMQQMASNMMQQANIGMQQPQVGLGSLFAQGQGPQSQFAPQQPPSFEPQQPQFGNAVSTGPQQPQLQQQQFQQQFGAKPQQGSQASFGSTPSAPAPRAGGVL
jgi:hypothetical protein